MHFAGYHTKVDLATDALAERSKAVAQGAIPKGRGFEPHRRHFCLLHQRNLTSRMGDRWGITERSHCLRGLMTSALGARCPGFNAQRKPLFLTLSCLTLFLGADHSEPPCPRSDKRWVVAITIRQHLGAIICSLSVNVDVLEWSRQSLCRDALLAGLVV